MGGGGVRYSAFSPVSHFVLLWTRILISVHPYYISLYKPVSLDEYLARFNAN